MSIERKFIVIAKQQEFDEEKWKQLLIAMAYFLHEQRKERAVEQSGSKVDAQIIP